jgi:hypothetical protein
MGGGMRSRYAWLWVLALLLALHAAYYTAHAQQPSVVELTTVDRQGRILDGVRLNVEPSSGVVLYQPSPGMFKLFMPAGRTYNLNFEWPSPYGVFARLSMRGTPEELQATNMGRAVMPVDDILVKVVDASGRPVNAPVAFLAKEYVIPPGEPSTEFIGWATRIKQVPLGYEYLVRAYWPNRSGVEIATSTIFVNPEGAGEPFTVLAALQDVNFAITDFRGRPLAGVRITVAPTLIRPEDVTVSRDGLATILRMPDAVYDFMVEWTSHYGTAAKTLVRATPTQMREWGKVQLPVDDVTVMVVDFHDLPVVGAMVKFAGHPIGLTDSQGMVAIPQVPIGYDYAIVVSKDGVEVGSDRVRFTASKTSVTIRAGIYDVMVLVKDAAGQPLQGVFIELIKNGTIIAKTVTDAAGTATFTNVVGGEYIIKSSYRQTTSTVTLPKGERLAKVLLDVGSPTRNEPTSTETRTTTTEAKQLPTENITVTLALTMAIAIGVVVGIAITLLTIKRIM